MIKKITVIALFLLITMIPLSAFADIGIGITGGWQQPSGVTFKMNNFPVVSLGLPTNSANSVSATLDYWFINNKIQRNFLWYVGAGVQANIGGSLNIIFRVPVGIQWYFMPAFELYGEIAPGLSFIPVDFHYSGGIGLRYHF